jgi:hypothetical protein
MTQTPSSRRSSTAHDVTVPVHQPTQKPKQGPRIVRRPASPEYTGKTFTITQHKLDAIIAQRVGETKAKFAPKAALADELVHALAVEAAYARALEDQIRSLGHDPLPRPTQTSKDTRS